MASPPPSPHHQQTPLQQESNWLYLPGELLTLILLLLPFPSLIQFGRVCHSWRSIALSHRHRTRPPPLLLTTFSTPWSDNPNISTSVFYLDPRTRTCRKLSMKLRVRSLEHPVQCHGPSTGWLLVLSPLFNNYLLNPTTNQQVYLPRLDGPWTICTAALSAGPNSSNCIVVAQAMHKQSMMLASWRPGDNQWACITTTTTDAYYGAMVFFDGRLFVTRSDGYMFVYTFSPVANVGAIMRPACLGDEDYFYSYYGCAFPFQVVVSGLQLQMIAIARDVKGKLVGFRVFRLEAERWIRVTSLGDRALLLSDYRSESIPNKDIVGSSEFRINCIYYFPKEGSSLVSVYSLEEERFSAIVLPYGIRAVDWFMPAGW